MPVVPTGVEDRTDAMPLAEFIKASAAARLFGISALKFFVGRPMAPSFSGGISGTIHDFWCGQIAA